MKLQPEYVEIAQSLREWSEGACPFNGSFSRCGSSTVQRGANALDKLMTEYMNICDKDCAGDSSTGVPPCPFFDFPDINIVGGCKLGGPIE